MPQCVAFSLLMPRSIGVAEWLELVTLIHVPQRTEYSRFFFFFNNIRICFTWMAPRAARKLYPISRGLLHGWQVWIWISGPAGEKPWDKPRMKTHPRSTGSYPVRTRVQTCYLPFSAARGLVSPTLTTQPQSRLNIAGSNSSSHWVATRGSGGRFQCGLWYGFSHAGQLIQIVILSPVEKPPSIWGTTFLAAFGASTSKQFRIEIDVK